MHGVNLPDCRAGYKLDTQCFMEIWTRETAEASIIKKIQE